MEPMELPCSSSPRQRHLHLSTPKINLISKKPPVTGRLRLFWKTTPLFVILLLVTIIFDCSTFVSSSSSSRSTIPKSLFSIAGGGTGVNLPQVEKQNATQSYGSSSSWIKNGLKNALASGMSAAVAKAAVAPLDTIKTIQQEQRTLRVVGALSGAAAQGGASANAVKPLSMWGAAQWAMNRKGGSVTGLYAGLGVAIVGSVPSVGLYFGLYSCGKSWLGPRLHNKLGPRRQRLSRTLTVVCSAAVGNAVASVARVPYEVLKQNMQMTTSSSLRSVLFGTTWFPPGSIVSQMARDVPYAVITLLSYELLRERYRTRAWATGAAAGALGSFATNPFDVIKTRMQTQPTAASERIYANVVDCAVKTWTEEGGAIAFLKGSVPRLMHKIPANAVFFLSYEFFRALLKVDDNRVVIASDKDKKDGDDTVIGDSTMTEKKVQRSEKKLSR